MPKIKFTADPKLPRDMAHLGYKSGMEIDLPQDQAERWIRRNVAIYAVAEPKAKIVLPEPVIKQTDGDFAAGAEASDEAVETKPVHWRNRRTK